jgi:thiamine monophosphate synthase
VRTQRGLAGKLVTSPGLLLPWNLGSAGALEIGAAQLRRWSREPRLAAIVLDACDSTRSADVSAAMTLCRELDCLVLSRRRTPFDVDVDGCLVDQLDEYAARLQAQGKLVGVRCGESQRDAVDAWSCGADLIVYGAHPDRASPAQGVVDLPELLRWWREMMTVPVAVEAAPVESIEELVWSGADLIIPAVGLACAGLVPAEVDSLFTLLDRHRI